MPDMYDKLGEMLNEALESGKIPTDRHCEDMDCFDAEASRNDEFKKSEKPSENPNNSRKNTRKFHCEAEKQRHCEAKGRSKPDTIVTGQVIKVHKYTYNMQYPPEIQKALATLDIAYPFTQKNITTAYHKKLKEVHPDTQNTTQTSQSVQNIRQVTIDDIVEAYKILCDFFEI